MRCGAAGSLLDSAPGALPDFFSQIQNAIMVGSRAESDSSAAAAGSGK